MVASIKEALVKCGAHDGMTVSFHHHFREGDLIVNISVYIPEHLAKDEKDAFEKMRTSDNMKPRKTASSQSFFDKLRGMFS